MKAAKKENKNNQYGWLRRTLTANGFWGVLLRIIILLAIPYAYLMLCGLIFDMWLRMYEMTTFIFYSLIALYVAALVLSVLTVVWTVKAKKAGKPAKANKEETEAK